MDEHLNHIISVIEQAIKDKKTSAAKVSTEAVGNFSMIRNMKLGKSPRLNNLKRLCDVLGLDLYVGYPQDYPGLTKATLLGSSKGEVLHSQHDITTLDNVEKLKDCEQISAPTNKGSIIAFTIGDDALSPLFSEGNVIFADLEDKCNPAEWERFIGEICIIQLQTGEVLFRMLRRGDKTDTFNLESLAKEPTLINKLPTICLPVCWVNKVIL